MVYFFSESDSINYWLDTWYFYLFGLFWLTSWTVLVNYLFFVLYLLRIGRLQGVARFPTKKWMLKHWGPRFFLIFRFFSKGNLEKKTLKSYLGLKFSRWNYVSGLRICFKNWSQQEDTVIWFRDCFLKDLSKQGFLVCLGLEIDRLKDRKLYLNLSVGVKFQSKMFQLEDDSLSRNHEKP